MFCKLRVTGLQAVHSVVGFEHLVCVRKPELSAPQSVHPNRCIFKYSFMEQKSACHNRHIFCGRIMVVVVKKSRAVCEMRVVHSESGGVFVHHLNKAFFRARNELRHCDGCVVCARNGDGLYHIVHAHLLSDFEIYLRSAHRSGVFACRNGVFRCERSFVEFFHYYQKRHDFCHACRGMARVAVCCVKNLARRGLHKHRRSCRQVKFDFW